MAVKNVLEIVITAKDEATKKLGGLNSVMGKLGVAAGIAGAAVVGAGVIIGKTIFNLAKESAQVEKLSRTFDSLAESIGENADIMIKDLRVASRGMLNDADLMQASNKLVAMGLAGTSEESAKLVEMSTQLGSAMGMTATDAAEAFALMLANQSIPRLDNFGISSGKVRDRIEELMEANVGMTRETAFMNAVMEQGALTMEKVGEQGEGAAANMARLEANVDNLKVAIGDRLRPILETITTKLLDAWDNPEVQAGIETLFAWIEKIVGNETSGIIGVITKLAEGDIGGALKMAFGEGVYRLVMGIASAIDRVREATDRLKTSQYGLAVAKAYATSAASSFYIPRQAGGPVSAGGSYLIGEEGPEMLTMGRDSGYITPNNKLGGAINLIINVNSAVSLSDMANAERVLLPIVERGLRTVMAR